MTSEPPRIRVLLRAPIHFAAESGEPVHAPLVLATIGAFHTRLILDTGSDVHLLTRELVEAAGLTPSAVDQGTDHSGSSLDSWVVGDVPLTFEEADGPATRTLHDVVAIPAPEAFTTQGIGGILSPQRLDETAWAVINEVGDELVLIDAAPDDLAAWLLDRRPTPDVIAIERRAGDVRPIVAAAVEPHGPVPVLMNTGGRHTEFEPGAVPGLEAGDVERIGTGVSGVAVMGAGAGSQVLVLGDRRVAIPHLMLRAGMADPPAMIGQDVLRGTILAVAPDTSRPILWQVSTLG
ncbi:MAG TPA: hypothetical protein VL749_07040 [Patescibacteria group bacterium]|nr:hypothetical protein [Patescibacteria group bacterium]